MNTKLIFEKKYLPYIASVITISIFIAMEVSDYRISRYYWYFPISWGFIKEVFIDPFIVLIFPWNGWVFLLPLLFGLYVKSDINVFFKIWIFTSISTGMLETIFNFTHYSIAKFAKGIFLYLMIFGTIFLLSIIFKKISERIFKCLIQLLQFMSRL